MAFNYLSYILFPLVICYTIYSVVYEKHKSWYSFIIGTLVGFVYTFGFISMTPQLFINYKLKSVAHMPGRTFMYKALNTFIDDLFAFVIKMPWLHRLACLRDDVVFFVYLYQRWIYPEDKRRRNEFVRLTFFYIFSRDKLERISILTMMMSLVIAMMKMYQKKKKREKLYPKRLKEISFREDKHAVPTQQKNHLQKNQKRRNKQSFDITFHFLLEKTL